MLESRGSWRRVWISAALYGRVRGSSSGGADLGASGERKVRGTAVKRRQAGFIHPFERLPPAVADRLPRGHHMKVEREVREDVPDRARRVRFLWRRIQPLARGQRGHA